MTSNTKVITQVDQVLATTYVYVRTTYKDQTSYSVQAMNSNQVIVHVFRDAVVVWPGVIILILDLPSGFCVIVQGTAVLLLYELLLMLVVCD